MLIKGLQEGREEAFMELVQLYRDRVYNTALGFVQQVEDAEEIAQDVFVKVFEQIGRFRGDAALSTWIYRIAVSQSLDWLRKKKRQKRTAFLVSFFSRGEDEWSAPDFNHPGVKAENQERSAILFKAIRQLPEQQQTAFLLQKLEGQSLADIAAIMNTTGGAVESLLHRAKANLKKLLQDYYSKHGI